MEKRKWSDLPYELLPDIADRLGLIELLRFRNVCKDWNSASETASAEIESLPDHKPWFLLYGNGESSQCHLVTESGKKYALHIPELKGTTTCIASHDGWLLLLQEGSPLFFCPFSRTKIELPQLPESNLSYHIAALSSPPTSEDCTVAVIGHNDELKIELYLLHRGNNAWTKHAPQASDNIGTIKCATCHEGTFYFFSSKNELLTVPVIGTVIWNSYEIVSRSSKDPSAERSLPFIQAKQEFKKRDMNRLLGLEEDVSVSICGTFTRRKTHDEVVFNEKIKAAAAAEEEEIRNLKGVWIQPRFFKISPELSW